MSFTLNEHATRCGDDSRLKDVWRMLQYDPEEVYFIEVSTLGQPDDEGASGTMLVPVKSVGKIGREFYFATDYRFVCWPSAECVFPAVRELMIHFEHPTGGIRGSLHFETETILRTPIRSRREDLLEELARWKIQHGDKWEWKVEDARLLDGVIVRPANEGSGLAPTIAPVALEAFDTTQ